MILRHVERGEIVEIILDLRSVGDAETERMEQCFDAFERARDRMESADSEAATGQRYVERFSRELPGEFLIGEFFASANKRRLQ